MNFKVVFILVGAVLVFLYRFAFPWTPFWVDVSVIAAAGLVALWQWGSENGKKPEQDKENSPRVNTEEESSH